MTWRARGGPAYFAAPESVIQADAPAAAAAYGSRMLVAAASTIALMVGFSLWWLLRGEDGQDGDWGWGGGGSEGSPPKPSDPAWWPDFEREFAAYVAGGARSAPR